MKGPYLRMAVAACILMSAMIAVSASFGFFMEPVTSDLGFGRGAFSFYYSVITIVGGVSLLVYGKLVDKIGVRKVVIVGGAWTGVAIALLSQCGSLPAFYAVAAAIGMGIFGCSYVAAPVLVDAWFREKNGTVMGAAAACGGLGAIILSIACPQVILLVGWRWGYVALGAVFLLLVVPTGIFLVRERPADMGLEPFGAKSGTSGNAEGMAGAFGMTFKEALKSGTLWVSVLAFLIFGITVSVTQHLPAYFMSVGFSPTVAGVLMSVIAAGIVVTNAATGKVADKAGILVTSAASSLLFALAFALLPPAGKLMLPVCVVLIAMSLGNAFNSVIAPVVTSTLFGTKDYSAIWGVISMTCMLGQSIGVVLWGLSFDMTGGYQLGMGVAAAANIIGGALLVLVLRHPATSAACEEPARATSADSSKFRP